MTRISIRFDEEELNKAYDFLEKHPEYKNISNLIRTAEKEYRKYEDNSGNIEMGLDEKTHEMINYYVEFKYFRDSNDLIEFVLRRIISDGTLKRILDYKVSEVNHYLEENV